MIAAMYSMLLKNLSRFVTLTNDETLIIRSLFVVKKFRKHQYILKQGDIARYQNFVAEGLTRTYELDDMGWNMYSGLHPKIGGRGPV